jgi:hypothetical protein
MPTPIHREVSTNEGNQTGRKSLGLAQRDWKTRSFTADGTGSTGRESSEVRSDEERKKIHPQMSQINTDEKKKMGE